MRGFRGALERAWYAGGGLRAWTLVLAPLALGYGAASSLKRRRASRSRKQVAGAHVIAVGNLTVGGTGKSSVARWLAAEAAAAGARAAILLRGHGARRRSGGSGVVPDFASYPLRRAVVRYGDEAIAHRLALPCGAAVAADPDRWRAARALVQGYGAGVLVLDDGWEQGGVRWDELWVVVDPRRPAGNGALLPAGPLRRPVHTLAEARRVVCLLEEPGETVPEATRAWVARHARGLPILRFRRVLRCVSPPGAAGAGAPIRRGVPAALVSGVGSPARLERFASAVGLDCRYHAAFPDHARWAAAALRSEVERARRAGARELYITEKDEARWPEGFATPIPVLVLRTRIEPLDSMEEALEPLRVAVARAAVARAGGIG
ncbi:MAG: tetraacyldisaccharide 4'-kinase [Candidatus Latescibacteria bacterium]|nr:tetraacyldisaccharide 4'-kinase [Candidatus Latescibacterota bacterium]